MINLDKALFLHTGGVEISRNDLGYLPNPPQTRTHAPVPHHLLLDGLDQQLAAHNLMVTQERFAISKAGQRFFGVFEIENETQGYSTLLGIRNSHDKSLPIITGLGMGVWICDNMSFSAEFMAKRKNTTHALRDMPKVLSHVIARANQARTHQDQQVLAYKGTPLDTKEGHHMLIEMAKQGVVPTQKLLSVAQSFERPDHEEFVEDGWTAWTLFNAVTEHLKDSSLITIGKRTLGLHSYLDHWCNVPELGDKTGTFGDGDFIDSTAVVEPADQAVLEFDFG